MPVSSKSSIAYSSKVNLSQVGDLLPFNATLICLSVLGLGAYRAAGPMGLALLSLTIVIYRSCFTATSLAESTGVLIASSQSIQRVGDDAPLRLLKGSFCGQYFARLRVPGNKGLATLWLFSCEQDGGEWRRFRVLWVYRHSVEGKVLQA